MAGGANYKVDLDNDIVRGALVLERGELRWPPPPPKKVEPEVKATREGQLPATVVAPLAAEVTGPVQGPVPAMKPPTLTTGIVMTALGVIALCAWMYLRYAEPEALV